MNTSFDPSVLAPAAARTAIRRGEITGPTTGFCAGYAQGNLVVLPKAFAWDFLLFCQRNPKACPLLEVADAGARTFAQFAPGSDIAAGSYISGAAVIAGRFVSAACGKR